MNHAPSPFAIERAMSAAQQLMASLGDDPDEALVRDTIDGETDALEIVRRLVRLALEAESMVEAVESRVHDLNARAARFTSRAQSARETVKSMLDALGVHRVVAEDFTVSLKLGPAKVLITDEQKLPEQYWNVTRVPNKTAIGKDIDAGQNVQGACRSNGSLVLMVKTK